ncbi:nitrate- and nitrite sensing domain-containing protein [Aquihabitans sp. G128]|uniref:sensor histidine kinase n=1 Tax=Aquihabitans sp. G128 TaxID=2849779 RepID=UPI001C22EC75|nr:nitrate- and nitrite sensing domain-containing protein [Aquihabitans sp. G128]QXC61648.1 nitrate- and nitrite sensing domain-containing protein [Aquihabitans sp. G128]
MTKRFPIRAKLALALFLPVLAMFAVSIYEVGQANRQVDRVRQDTDLAGAALGPGGLIRSLQDERNDSAISAVGLRASAGLVTKDLADSRRVVDDAVAEFRSSLAQSGAQAEAVYRPALDAFDKTVKAARAEYDDAPGKASLARLPLSNRMWEAYSVPIDALISANTRLTLLIDDPDLRSAAEALDAVSRQFEDLGTMVRTGIISSLGGSKIEGTTKNDVIRAISQFESDKVRVTLLAAGPYRAQAAGLADNSAYQDAIDLLQAYIETDKLDTTGIISAVSRKPTPNLDTVNTAVTKALRDRSATLRDDAQTRQRTFVGLAVLVLVVGGAFMIVAARSVTRPLLSLTRQAEDMASTRLPAAVQEILDTPLGEDVVIPTVEPVAVKTRDEVREVAVALNSVQSSAIDLAVEQAVLRRNIADSFVNLGRRTQNLIGRQLDFITDLERNETDPATLNNLFKLDHLATRARRNAESLVVLAGLATPRTWAAPIAMGDVIRAALSEVEDYQRVEIRSVGEATVPGRTAADLVHLLAELIENGLSFSPPGRPVEVHGRMTRNGYVLAVLDHGIGMTEEEVELANNRLAGRESYTVAPSRYLGHYVAGSLASRIGVSVRLDESPTGGIAAKIVLPPDVLEQAPELAAQPALAAPREPAVEADAVPTPARQQTVVPEAQPDHDDVAPPAPVGAAPPAASSPPPLGFGPTTEHGLRKRVRRSSTSSDDPTAPLSPVGVAAAAIRANGSGPSANGASTNGSTANGAAPHGASAAAPAPTPAPVVDGPAPTPVAEPTAAPAAPEPPAEQAVPPVPPAVPAAAPPAPPRTDPWAAAVVDAAPTPARPAPGGPHAAPVARATAGWGTATWPPAPAADQPEPAAPTPAAEDGPAGEDATTANGLRKRVPGDQLAASSLSPMIRRAAIPAAGAPDPAASTGRAGAENLFSVLSSFESGVRRGHDDLAKVATRPDDPDAAGSPAAPNEQEV